MKKIYTEIADAMLAARPNGVYDEELEHRSSQWMSDCRMLAFKLGSLDANFEPETFLLACGVSNENPRQPNHNRTQSPASNLS